MKSSWIDLCSAVVVTVCHVSFALFTFTSTVHHKNSPSFSSLPLPFKLGLREIEDSLQLAQRQEDARQLQLEIEDKEQQLRIRGFDGYEQ